MSQSDRYNQAIRFREEGNLHAALSEFEADILEYPQLARSYLGLGEIYAGSGRWEKAKEVYSKAVLLESSPDSYFLLGEALYQCGYPLQAVEAFRMSIQSNPHLIESHLALATLYGNTKNPFMKELFLKNALLLEESNPLVMEELIALYTQNYRYEEAVSMAQKYLMEYPQSIPMKLILIENLIKMNKFHSAFEYLSICLNEDPQMLSTTSYQTFGINREKIKKLLIKKKKKLLNSLASLPDPKISMEMSVLFLLYGDLRNSAKYLVYSIQLKERIQMVP